jgi:hypothetical protein
MIVIDGGWTVYHLFRSLKTLPLGAYLTSCHRIWVVGEGFMFISPPSGYCRDEIIYRMMKTVAAWLHRMTTLSLQ